MFIAPAMLQKLNSYEVEAAYLQRSERDITDDPNFRRLASRPREYYNQLSDLVLAENASSKEGDKKTNFIS